ncbi:MAG: YcjX family protein [Hyphomicrobiaceae bacterium]|nr:YcjX family protein [Hyphomicrobiaceae bacterium]
MDLSDFQLQATSALRSAGQRFADLMTPTLRLGVTGLARSGKTVFITAFVRALLSGGRLPYFQAMAEGRIERTYLEPQPDDSVPRFAYEEHLADLAADPPRWPESTRRISQLRLTIGYRSTHALRRTFGSGRLHVDIVDYPGEWLADLGLIDTTYEAWCRSALQDAEAPRRTPAAAEWLGFMRTLDAGAAASEQAALKGADLFTRYLRAARAADPALAAPGPGRFLLPGELEGSPLLTFFPLALPEGQAAARGSLHAMLARRFESYKSHVAKPFFRDHFARIDRQIVLMDALGAANAGPGALDDLEGAMGAVLRAFRPGANTWLSSILSHRVDRIVFAATKADHLHHASHDRLEAVLRMLADQAIARAEVAGAGVKVMALAALRATREAEARSGRQMLPVIVGTPLAGERVAGRVFDGRTEAGIFPGDLPEEAAILRRPRPPGAAPAVEFPRFRPPRLGLDAPSGEAPPFPHIRLDRAIEFLIGDLLQ